MVTYLTTTVPWRSKPVGFCPVLVTQLTTTVPWGPLSAGSLTVLVTYLTTTVINRTKRVVPPTAEVTKLTTTVQPAFPTVRRMRKPGVKSLPRSLIVFGSNSTSPPSKPFPRFLKKSASYLQISERLRESCNTLPTEKNGYNPPN